MVDNFDIIRKILRFDNDGECYYVQLLRRAADDPKPDGKPDPAYHGSMHSRSVKDYFIHLLEHLDRVEAGLLQGQRDCARVPDDSQGQPHNSFRSVTFI